MQQSDEKFIQQLPSYWQQEQQHILPYVRTSSSLFQEISNLDTQAVQQAIDACLHGQSIHISDYKPAHYWPLLPAPQQQAYYTQAQQVGLDLITQGKVAAFTVAGGQGTRLGYDGPKGTLPVTLLQNKSLFQNLCIKYA